MQTPEKISMWLCAGAFGGVTNALFVWGTGASGVNAALGIPIAPAWTPAFLYQRVVWGGLWGLIFALPVLKNSVWVRGTLFGLAPTAAVLTVFGLEPGGLVPAFAVAANAVWGITAAAWIRCHSLETAPAFVPAATLPAVPPPVAVEALKIPWYFKTTTLVIAILSVGPFALPLLWWNPRFKPLPKIIITMIVLIVSLYLAKATASTYRTFQEYYDLLGGGLSPAPQG